MTCLVIVDSTPIDTMSLDLYKEKAAPTLKPFNGEFIAKGEIEVLHGETSHPLKAVIQFPDKDSARNWYNSDAYQAIIPLRNKGMNSQFHLV